jgi:HPt (histidine-containing phosphotransfer) domain-containing protein
MTTPTIDPATFAELQQTAGADFVVELVGTFFEEAPQMLAELRAALAAGSAERFRRAAHSLKTNANTFGALVLGGVARELELGGLPVDARQLDVLDAAYAQAKAALTELTRG